LLPLSTPRRSSLFPYTTLFRSSETLNAIGVPLSSRDDGVFRTMTAGSFFTSDTDNAVLLSLDAAKRINEQDPKSLVGKPLTLSRSEEHTSELQSLRHLVCRLLL